MTCTRRGLLVVLALLAIAGALALSKAMRVAPDMHGRVISALNERFGGEVDVEALRIGVYPRPELSGAQLTVRPNGRTDIPPLVRIGAFSASADIDGLVGIPIHLRRVELDRLEIHVPPDGLKSNENLQDTTHRPPTTTHHAPSTTHQALLIDEIVSHAARLEIPSKQAGKPTRIFDIHDLHILGFGGRDGADFRAELTNPMPEGRVATQGRFGPWQRDEPRRTPLRGEYTFNGANLDTIKGLGGTLSSRGGYSGVLERIEVTGETETPDFSIDVGGQSLPLTARFRAIVDGTNGDTWLEQVDAMLLESHIHARGAIVRADAVQGRHVALELTVDHARIEDLLRLAMKSSNAPVTGAVKVTTKFFLPAGPDDVVCKLRLNGEFTLDEARFTNFDVQRRLSELSQRARGDETPEDGESVVSKLRGRFALKDSTLTFDDLTFAVPGAVVQLAGTYHLGTEMMDFAGHLMLDASLRDTTSGFKAVLATIAQPFFLRRGGGTKLPIRVTGTRQKPQFGVDVKKVFFPGKPPHN